MFTHLPLEQALDFAYRRMDVYNKVTFTFMKDTGLWMVECTDVDPEREMKHDVPRRYSRPS